MEVAPVRIRAFAMRDSEMGLFFVLKGVFLWEDVEAAVG